MDRLGALFILCTVACGPSITKYSVDAKLGPDAVDGTYNWGSVGERFRNPGIRNLSPALEVLDPLVELARWKSYTDERSCFEIVSYQRIALVFPDGQGNQQEDAADWKSATHVLTTSSGLPLKPEPATVEKDAPLEVNYESLDTATNQWVPAMERFAPARVEVCFATPKPLAKEPWVRWTYTLANKARVELTFKVQAR